MSVEQEQAPSRQGRPKRAQETAAKRRRRDDGANSKLDIPDEIKAKYPDMEFRHAIDRPGRMQKLTVNDDWDEVPGVDPIYAGVGADGKAENYHLLMKPKEFMAEDRAKKEAKRQKQMAAARNLPNAQQALATDGSSYGVSGNQI